MTLYALHLTTGQTKTTYTDGWGRDAVLDSGLDPDSIAAMECLINGTWVRLLPSAVSRAKLAAIQSLNLPDRASAYHSLKCSDGVAFSVSHKVHPHPQNQTLCFSKSSKSLPC
jgi:hypothetical protein